MKSICLYVLFFSLSLISQSQEVGYPIIRNYTTREYNNEPQVFAAIQDKSGILYFSSADGIMEYDGVRWRNIPIGKDLRIYDFAINRDDKIYVAANGDFGYLYSDDRGNSMYQSLLYLLPDTFTLGTIWSLRTTSKFVYFQTYGAILQYSPDYKSLKIFSATPNHSFSGSFVYNDFYYTHLGGYGLIKIENNEMKTLPQTEFFKNKSLVSAFPLNDSTLIIPTRTEGLYKYFPNSDLTPQSFEISDKNFVIDNDIYDATSYLNDYYVLGSIVKGALLVDKKGKVLQRYQESNLLQNNEIYVVHTDQNKNIWVGLSNGISKVESGLDLTYWDKNNGLKGSVQSVIRFRDTIYVATSVGVFFIDDNRIQNVKNIPVGQNWCFLPVLGGKSLWVGTSMGIYEINGDQAIPLFYSGQTLKLYKSIKNPNRILCSGETYLFSVKYDDGKWIYEGQWAGINDDIRGIIEDDNGTIWLGTFRNGVVKITPDYRNVSKPKSVRYYVQKDGFESLKNILPFNYKDKIVWGTDRGLYIYNTRLDRFEPYCELGLNLCNGNSDVFSLQETPDGKVWICPLENKKADIGYLQPYGKGFYDWVFAPFRRIPNMFLTAFFVESNGVAWIGGSEGLYRYDMREDKKNYTQTFNCLIRRIVAGKDSLVFGGDTSKIKPISLPFELNTLKFEFAAPFFDHEGKTLYSYQLVGFDKGWSDWTRNAEKEYTNLSRGTYTFQVKARNVYDVESKTSKFEITILSPFYLTWWAYCIYIILFGLFIFAMVKLFTLELVRQKEHLEQVVQTRTAEIVLQKEKIQSQRDELAIANATKDKFFSIIAHDLRNPFNTLLGFSDLLIDQIKSKDFDKSYEFAKIIHKTSSVSYELLENLLNWSRSQTGKISFHPEDVDIKSLIDTNILLLNNLAEKKGIVLTSTLNHKTLAFADKNMVLTILRNLITNAIKFSRKGDKITVSLHEDEEYYTIRVSDTGIGIDETTIAKLFLISENIKTEGTDNEQGTGLGLILCKEFVEYHKGKIWVESQVGVGSIFSFTLPRTSLGEG